MTIIEERYHWGYHPGERNLTTHLVLHHAAVPKLGPQEMHQWHLSKGLAGIAYHYYVRKDGRIHAGRPELWKAGDTARWRNEGIHICFEGNFDIETMQTVQIDAGQRLISYIRRRYLDISIKGCGSIAMRESPGRFFPMESVVQVTEEDQQAIFEKKLAAYFAQRKCTLPEHETRQAQEFVKSLQLYQNDTCYEEVLDAFVTQEQMAVSLWKIYHLSSEKMKESIREMVAEEIKHMSAVQEKTKSPAKKTGKKTEDSSRKKQPSENGKLELISDETIQEVI